MKTTHKKLLALLVILVMVLAGCAGEVKAITSDIDISGFITPIIGETAVTAKDLWLNSEECHIKDLQWYDDATGTPLDQPLSFEDGHLYYAKITLAPNDGFSFDTPAVTLNGENSLLQPEAGSVAADEITITTISFSTEQVDGALHFEVPLPEPGQTSASYEENVKVLWQQSGEGEPVELEKSLIAFYDETEEIMFDSEWSYLPDGGSFVLRVTFLGPEGWNPIPLWDGEDNAKRTESFCELNGVTVTASGGMELAYLTHYAESCYAAFFRFSMEKIEEAMDFTLPTPKAGDPVVKYPIEDISVTWTNLGTGKSEPRPLIPSGIYWQLDDEQSLYGGVNEDGSYIGNGSVFQEGNTYSLQVTFEGKRHWTYDMFGTPEDCCKENDLSISVSDGYTLASFGCFAENTWYVLLQFTVPEGEGPNTPEPTQTPEPTKPPEPTQTPEPTKPPEPTQTPEPTQPPVQTYGVSCTNCTFTGGGYVNATYGEVPAGTVITVTGSDPTRLPTSWSGVSLPAATNSFQYTVNGTCKFYADYSEVIEYDVYCSNCTFSGGGYSNASSGKVPAGTVITVTGNQPDRAPSSWAGAYDAGTAGSFAYVVNGPCRFVANYDEPEPAMCGVSCQNCTFSGGGYSGATFGTVPAGTVITVTADVATRCPSSWAGSCDAGTAVSFQYTVTDRCQFTPQYD